MSFPAPDLGDKIRKNLLNYLALFWFFTLFLLFRFTFLIFGLSTHFSSYPHFHPLSTTTIPFYTTKTPLSTTSQLNKKMAF